jgi:hypothetical protein
MIHNNKSEWWDLDCFIWRQAVSVVAGFLNQHLDVGDQSKIIIRAINELEPLDFPDAKTFGRMLVVRGQTVLKTMDYDVYFPSMLLEYSEYVETVVQIVKNSSKYVK